MDEFDLILFLCFLCSDRLKCFCYKVFLDFINVLLSFTDVRLFIQLSRVINYRMALLHLFNNWLKAFDSRWLFSRFWVLLTWKLELVFTWLFCFSWHIDGSIFWLRRRSVMKRLNLNFCFNSCGWGYLLYFKLNLTSWWF